MDVLKNKQLKLLIYVSKIIFPKHHCCSFPLYMFVQYYKIKQLQRTYFLNKTDITFIQELSASSADNITDENNTVIVNNKYLKEVDFALLNVRFYNKSYRRYVRLLCHDIAPKGIIIITNPLLCNITENLEITSSESDIENLRVQIFYSSVANINFANEIELALINNPSDFSNSIIDTLLNNYFLKPKLVHECDVIEINVKYYLEGFLCNVSKITNYSNSVYFKCMKILPRKERSKHGYFIVKGETTLKQVPNIQEFIPLKTHIASKCKHFEGIYTNKSEGIPNCPYGLESYAAQIEDAIKPFLAERSKEDFNIYPAFLLVGKKGTGKELLISSIASRLGMHFYRVTNFDLTAQVYAQSETKLNNIFFNAKLCSPCILYIKDFENFEKNQEGKTDERIISHFAIGLCGLFENNKYPLILICSSNEENVSGRLKREFIETFKINPPSEVERMQILKWLLDYENISYNLDLEEIAQKTNSFLYGDLKALVQKARCFLCDENQLEEVNNEHFDRAIDYMQKHYNESIGAPKVPKVQWDDVGGLTEVKREIIKTINLPLKHPELVKATGLSRFGILLFGPPGTGKTLLAKAVATECNLCFLSVKGPELLNMYIGQSEENIREVFSRARAASPCIIFFDELDSLAPNRGVSGDSGGVMDRVVSQLLAEMDGINEKATVFIIGATNRPDLIDPALLRPGRFDKLLYVGPSVDFDSRLSVLKALTRKFNLAKELDLEEVIRICPKNISGADFYGICSNSWTNAVRRSIQLCENGPEDAAYLTTNDVVVNLEDFIFALQNVKPSISEEDLRYFEKLRKEIGSNA